MVAQRWTVAALVFLFVAGSSLLKWYINSRGKKAGSLGTIKAVTMIVVTAVCLTVFVSLPLFERPKLAGVIAPPAGFLLIATGLFINILVAKELRHVRFEMRGLGIPDRLVTTGPFAVIRHPSSVGILFMVAGWYLVWRALYCLCLAVPVIVIGILIENHLEERNLESTFGDAYLNYRKRVGRYLPGIPRPRMDRSE